MNEQQATRGLYNYAKHTILAKGYDKAEGALLMKDSLNIIAGQLDIDEVWFVYKDEPMYRVVLNFELDPTTTSD